MTNTHFSFGESPEGRWLSVAAAPKLVVASFWSTYVSTSAPVTVQVAFVSVCEPAHRCHEVTLSDAAYATLEVTPSVSASEHEQPARHYAPTTA